MIRHQRFMKYAPSVRYKGVSYPVENPGDYPVEDVMSSNLHEQTAAKIFGTSEEEVTPEQRLAARAVDFGALFGGVDRFRESLEGASKDTPKEEPPFTPEENRVLREALTLLIHIHLGKADRVMEPVLLDGLRDCSLTTEESLEARAHLERAAEIITGIRHGGPGLFSPRVSRDARVALEMLRKITTLNPNKPTQG